MPSPRASAAIAVALRSPSYGPLLYWLNKDAIACANEQWTEVQSAREMTHKPVGPSANTSGAFGGGFLGL